MFPNISTLQQTKARLILLVLIVFVQLAFIGSAVVWNQIIISTGTHVLIRLPQPVDPPSLFRGNYVSLNYTISNIDVSDVTVSGIEVDATGSSRNFSYTEVPVWVTLEKEADSKWWDAVAVSKDKPELSGGQVALKGKARIGFGGALWVTYGIEQYFIPQKYESEANTLLRGRFFDDPSVAAEVGADVVIHSGGASRVVGVEIGGVPLLDLLEGKASVDDVETVPFVLPPTIRFPNPLEPRPAPVE